MDASMLKLIYLFSDFTESELKKVAAIAEVKNFISGQEIFSVGQTATALYVIVMGSVKISIGSKDGDEIQIRHFGSGSHFGEMPMMDGDKRSATVQTTENSHLAEISYAKLLSLFDQDPALATKFYRSAARFLAVRLRATTTDLNHFKELKFQH
jgi:CRP/FNR family cyclic AMP-dependent transcriptional regulator